MQRASQLRRIRDSAAAEAAAEGRPWTDAEWVQAAGLPSARLLGSALAAGQAAGRRLIDVNKGLLYRLTAQFANQVPISPAHQGFIFSRSWDLVLGARKPRP